MKSFWLAALCGAAITISATSASALGTTYGATFSGVANGVDTLGLFGAKNSTLKDVNFTEMFLINTLAGTRRTSTTQDDEYGSSSRFIQASLQINGKTVTVSSSIWGETFVNNGGNTSNSTSGIKGQSLYSGGDYAHVVYDAAVGSTSLGGDLLGVLVNYAENPNLSFKGFPTGLDQSFSISVGSAGTTGVGAFVLTTACGDVLESLTLKNAVSAAPEPATWSFMLCGVAGMGMALRSQRGRARKARLALAKAG